MLWRRFERMRGASRNGGACKDPLFSYTHAHGICSISCHHREPSSAASEMSSSGWA